MRKFGRAMFSSAMTGFYAHESYRPSMTCFDLITRQSMLACYFPCLYLQLFIHNTPSIIMNFYHILQKSIYSRKTTFSCLGKAYVQWLHVIQFLQYPMNFLFAENSCLPAFVLPHSSENIYSFNLKYAIYE